MSLPGGTAKLRQEGGTRSVPGQGPGAGSLGQEEEGYAKPRAVRVPSGRERVGRWGREGLLDTASGSLPHTEESRSPGGPSGRGRPQPAPAALSPAMSSQGLP